MPRFDKIRVNMELDPSRKYEILKTFKGLGATHVGLKNGIIAFFWSPDEDTIYKSNNNWLFIKIPEGARALCFPEAKRDYEGWHYGVMSANNYKRIDG